MSNANAIFDSVFKLDLAKSADPDAVEMMNRVSGNSSSESSKPMGRPKNAPPSTEELQAELLQLRLKLNVDPENPLITSLVLDENDSCHLLIGSVLQLVMPDGSLQSVVLRDDVRVFPFG